MTASERRKFHDRGEQDLADRILMMDEQQRQAFDHLREFSPAASAREDEVWVDVDDEEPMDIELVLDGTNPVDLSHEGGEFCDLVEHCIEATTKQAPCFYFPNFSDPRISLESVEWMLGPAAIKSTE
jgi:hypothetical protein